MTFDCAEPYQAGCGSNRHVGSTSEEGPRDRRPPNLILSMEYGPGGSFMSRRLQMMEILSEL